jgi:hypothetical protein
MILPTGRLGITGHSTRGQARRHRTFETEPHSARQARISARYHGQVIDRMNPTRRRDNAVRYPQTGLGG